LIDGLAELGIGTVGKHFPGHGFVRADSHVDLPVDGRNLDEIRATDMLPYRELIPRGLAAVMPAHVIYANVDPHPAGFSKFWLQQMLRGEYGFEGLIFSDDLSMQGASVVGGVVERAQAALAAGCDMALVCNAPGAAREVLDKLGPAQLNATRAENMRRHRGAPLELDRDARYQRACIAYKQALDNALFA
jgi:beta-N-acetylhexosaminidase